MARKKATESVQVEIPEVASVPQPQPRTPQAPPAGKLGTVTSGVATEIERFQTAMAMSILFAPPSADVPKEQGVVAWNALATMGEIFAAQLALWREYLLALAEKEGVTTDMGGQSLDVEGTRVVRERRKMKLPDEQGVKELLARNSLPISECFDEVKTLVLNPSKLDYLIQAGRISADQVEAMKKVTWALKVKPSETLDESLERLRMAFNVAPRKKLHG